MLSRALLQSLDLFPETGEAGAKAGGLLAMSYGTDLLGLCVRTRMPGCTTQMLDYHLCRMASRDTAVAQVRPQLSDRVVAGETHDIAAHAHLCWQRNQLPQVLSGCAPNIPSASQFEY